MANSRSRETIAELWETIEFLNCKLESRMPKQHPPQLTGDLKRDMIILIKEGKPIDAVKLHKKHHKAGLWNAMNAMKDLRIEIAAGKHP